MRCLTAVWRYVKGMLTNGYGSAARVHQATGSVKKKVLPTPSRLAAQM
jgi:hypothetical protein